MLKLAQRFTGALVALLVAAAPAASQTPVDLELSLLVDVSGSVDGSEFLLQRDGYEAAFRSAALWNAIDAGDIGSIAANFIYWSSSTQQQEAVGWMLIDSQAAAIAFADNIAGAVRPFSGGTDIGPAITYATPRFFNNAYDGTRQVIDVSGDGTSNSFVTSAARDAALLAGVDAINGLVIDTSVGASLYNFYEDNVISPNGFVEVANEFTDFEAAVSRKLIREIQQPSTVPEPASLILLGSGLVGLGFVSRRRRNKVTE